MGPSPGIMESPEGIKQERMVEFILTTTFYPITMRGKFRGCFSMGRLSMGDVIAPVKDKTLMMVVATKAEPTPDGWLYDVELMDTTRHQDPPFIDDILPIGTAFIRTGHSGYSGDLEWGPARPFEETLTPQQALKLAIETLENFSDEYSDVQPIIDKLKKAL